LKILDKKLAEAAEELQDAQPKRESGSFVFDEDFFFRILGFVTNTSNLFMHFRITSQTHTRASQIVVSLLI
jgi:hypothetical protein